VAAALLSGAGILGLLLSGGTATALWVSLLGLGQGASISLALILFALRTTDSTEATELSGMAQSVGYLLAAAGPFLFGVLHDLTQSWSLPLALILAVVVGLFFAGVGAGRDAYVNPERRPS
jgi:CP family cyanate transporter-like MFS transporter